MDNHKPPAFQFYPKDWLSEWKVQRLSYEHRGMYFQILCHMWANDPKTCRVLKAKSEIARILGITKSRASKFLSQILMPDCCPFEEVEMYFVSKRLKAERDKQIRYHNERAKAGKIGAAKRWHKDKDNDS